MNDKTPFQEWWERIGGRNLNDPKTEDMAHRAWIAALQHARELMREPGGMINEVYGRDGRSRPVAFEDRGMREEKTQ